METRKLYITRHADALPSADGRNDFIRSLSAKGKSDAQEIGNRLKESGVSASLMLSSPATRTLMTCNLLAKSLGYKAEKIQSYKSLYGAGVQEWLAIIGQLSDVHTHVMIVGHNPGCTNLVNALLNTHFTILPTCSVVSAKLHITSWEGVKSGCGNLDFFLSPDLPQEH